ncbi:hybrid sensor histidine kinase/response regulator transcription factor [Bacteroides finegoldii]|uniref:hybrid sensor histidine kinase/response regulator transcription factor n=1 Tax=Bacteroides finegoldii TaxID=338188 RepID=UPI0022DF94EC|nr:hybrid sensor histidine kinase/response regulator transcription factor [Bacteroides finegoldii]
MKKHLLSALFCLFVLTLQASERLNFRTFDVKSGIADNYVQSILCDRYGFMWFSTLNGLSRYDGYQFKTYTTTQLGAYNNDIEFTAEDASGTIWIKTPKSYYFYNREKDEIDNHITPILEQSGIYGTPDNLYIDKDLNLWCTVNSTLYYYVFRQKELYTLSLPQNCQVLQIDCYQSNAYVLLSDSYIYHVDWRAQNLCKEVQIVLPLGWKQRMYIDTFSRLWLYVPHTKGVCCYDPNAKEWFSFPGEKEITNELITAVIDDGKGNIWIGTDNKGIYISYHQDGKGYERLSKEVDNPFSLPNNHICCFYKDHSDIMWVGTSKLGATFTSLHNVTFETCRLPQQEDVSCLVEDKDGNLWLGFDGEGLAYYDRKKNNYTFISKKQDAIPSDIIVCSYKDSKGRLWFGSYGNGAFYEQNGKFSKVATTYEQKYSIDYVRCITEDKYGNIWLGTIMNGIYCLDNTGNITPYTMEKTGMLTNSITTFSCADGINLYIGTSSGLYCMNTETKEISLLENNNSASNLFEEVHINCIYQDTRGLLWIGTRKGMDVYNKNTKERIHLSTKNGLSHDYIRAITEDKEKNIWVTTDHGVTNIIATNSPEPSSKFLCYPYFEEDGIGNMAFNNHSITCTQQGEILMGGSGGYLRINPRFINYRHESHPVIYTSLYLANQRMEVGSKNSSGRILLNKNIQLLNEITMDYSDSNFALEVSSMDYNSLHKLQYAYRLNKDEEWVKLEGNRIYFNKLSPGTYQLEVKVYENNNSYKNSKASCLTIHVLPPFWLSVPAYIGYTLLLAGVIIFFFLKMKRKHIRNLSQQKREMEIIQQHEMDEAKMRFFTNVSHDLRTPLSLIIIPLEKLLSSNLEKGVKEELELIHRNSETLLNEVNQLLDFRKLDQQKTQLMLSHGNLSDFVKEVCGSFIPQAVKKGINIRLHINETKMDMDFDRNKIQRILLNLLSNAVKYNYENGEVIVALDKITANGTENAQIQVADTGIGIKDENKDKIFDRFFQEQHSTTTYIGNGIGLHIVKEYVTMHHGTITVENHIPQGTIFTITLPVTHNYAVNDEKQDEAEIREKAVDEVSDTTDTHKTSLLIVEDNDDFRNFLINCLKGTYQVFDAPNGKEALEILAHQSIQIVISDVMMPEMDGMELCRKIKTDIRYSHIPVILLTARTADEHELSGLKEGADDYITKPFNLEILLLRIQKILKWTKNNHEKFKTIDISPSEITVSSLDEQLIEKAIRAVEENMDNSEFSVEELSSYVGMSRGHLYKKLIMITGKSPLEFIRILRVKRGKQLLEQSQLNVSQIAYQIGLSPKQFAKYFKEEFGYVPSEYIKNNNTN